MPPATPTGLHEPVTNVPPSESSIGDELFSAGDAGVGEALELAEGAISEPVARPRLEALIDLVAPDTTGLPDVGVASFGAQPRLEAVIGTDERIEITDTTKLPWRLSASLLITAADNSQYIGTGWFVSPRTLVTAGHCVCIKHSPIAARNGFVKKIQVMPGRRGSTVPYGGLTSTEFWTVRGWSDHGMELYDYGAIILPSAFAQRIGHFAFGVLSDQTLLAAVANIGGYPGDKPSGTFWYDQRQIGSVKPEKVFYAADTAGGQSGACVYVIRNRQRVGVAIHAYGGATANSGTRISNEVFANLTAWKR